MAIKTKNMILLDIEDFISNNPPEKQSEKQYLKIYNYNKFLQKELTIDMVYPKKTALIKNVVYNYENDENGHFEHLDSENGAGFFYRKLPNGKWKESEGFMDIRQHIIEGGKLEIDEEILNEILEKPFE